MTECEALKLALEAFEAIPEKIEGWIPDKCTDAVIAIKEALREHAMYEVQRLGQEIQPEQEPVAYLCENAVGHKYFRWKKPSSTYKPIALYTTPPQRTWVGLTPQERDEINEQVYGAVPHHVAFHAAIEAKLKEKNT